MADVRDDKESSVCLISEVESPVVGRMQWCETHGIYFGLNQPCPYGALSAGEGRAYGALSAGEGREPAAWLEIDKEGDVIGVSREKDPFSPFTWEPLYRRTHSARERGKNG
jgi:hypothetical protein